MIENGQRPDENQVSKTSSSCSRVNGAPLAKTLARFVASSRVLPTTQFLPSLIYELISMDHAWYSNSTLTSCSFPSIRTKYAGHRWPHHNWREIHQSWIPSNQRYHSFSDCLGVMTNSPAFVRYNHHQRQLSL